VKLHHTQPRSLIHHEQRTAFLVDFITLIRFLADGMGNVGLLRRSPECPIHRDIADTLSTTASIAPPQRTLDPSELASWIGDNDKEYEP
jgi:hypothetical protein